MGKKKYKPLTKKEKAFNKQIKAEMIAKGILPPPKPRLNRKKFAEEVREEFRPLCSFGNFQYFLDAILWMTSTKGKISSEELGVFKVLKIAVELKKFTEEKRAAGESEYNLSEAYEKVVYPIMKL